MPGRSTLLSNYPVVRSSDPALVRDRLFSVYGANSFDVGRADGAFAINADHLQIGGLGLSYGEYTGNVSVGFGEVSFVRQCFSIEGAARYAGSTQSGEIAPGSWTPVLHAQPLKFDHQSGHRQLVLRIEFDALLRNLSTLIGRGRRPKSGFRRKPGAPIGDGSAAPACFSSGHRLQ